MTTSTQIQRVQGLMMFLGAVADSLESLTGTGAEAVCFRAGQQVGLNRRVTRKETALFPALDAVKEEMRDMGINWPFETDYKRQFDPELVINCDDGSREIKLPFKNCIVRCTLFRYGFPQGKALCQTKHGLFCGLFQNIYGARSYLGITHAGENACLLNLKIYPVPIK